MQPIPPSTLKLIEQIDTVFEAQGASPKLHRLTYYFMVLMEKTFESEINTPSSCFKAIAKDIPIRRGFMATKFGRELGAWLSCAATALPYLQKLNADGLVNKRLCPSYPPVKIFVQNYQEDLPELLPMDYSNGFYDTESEHVVLPNLSEAGVTFTTHRKSEDYESLFQQVNNFISKKSEKETDIPLKTPSPLTTVQSGRWETEALVQFTFPVDQSKKCVRLPNQQEAINAFAEALEQLNKEESLCQLLDKEVRHVFHLEDSSKDDFKGIYACWDKSLKKIVLTYLTKPSAGVNIFRQQFEIGLSATKMITEALLEDELKTINKISVLSTFLYDKTDCSPVFYKQIEQALKMDHPPTDLGTRRIQKRDKADPGSSTIWGHQGKKYIVLSRKYFTTRTAGEFKHIHLAFRVDDLRSVLLGERYIWMTLDSTKTYGREPPAEQPESVIFSEILRQGLTDSYLLQPVFVVNQISPNSPNKLGIMTEYCDVGVFEEQYLEQHDLGLKERIELFIQLLKAVRGLHEKIHYYHCDIKEENILLTRVDGKIEVRLSDFGLAQRIGSNYNKQGTPYALPPEIHMGNWAKGVPFTASVDVFALGHVLLNVLLEKPSEMFYAEEDEFAKMIREKANFSSLSGDCLDRQLYRLAYRMLDRDPKSRPTLVELEESFQAIYKDENEIQATQTMINKLTKQSSSRKRSRSKSAYF